MIAASRNPDALEAGCEVALMPDMQNSESDYTSLMHGVEIVVHAAGLAHADVDDAKHDQINRASMLSLVNAARDATVKHFIFISSVAAQTGSSSEKLLTEDDPPAPDSAYARSKLAAETVLRESNLDFTILRPVVVAGPDAKGSLAALEKIARLPLPLPFASLKVRRSTLSIDNLCSALLLIMDNQAGRGQTFLVADPKPKSVSEIVAGLRVRARRSPNLFPFPPVLLSLALTAVGKGRLAASIHAPLVVSTAKLEALGWTPVHNGLI